MSFLKKIATLIVYSNVLIAFCASSLCYFSILFFKLNQYIPETIGFVFFSTIFTYAFHRKIDHLYYGNRELTEQDVWIKKNQLIYQWILISSFVGSFVFYNSLPKSTSFLIFPLLLISLLYVIKFKFGIRTSSLRSIPYLKPFVIAFVWGGIAALLPIVNNYGLTSLSHIEYHLFAISMGLFVFGQSIPFDIRDYRLDKSSNLKTLAHLLGNKRAKSVCFVSYLSSLSILFFISAEVNLILMALAIALLVSGIIIWNLSEKKSDLHFSLVHESSLAFPLICFNILALF